MDNLPFKQNINWVAAGAAVVTLFTYFFPAIPPNVRDAILLLAFIGALMVISFLHTFINHPANQQAAEKMVSSMTGMARKSSSVIALFLVLTVILLGGALTGCASNTPPPISTNPVQTAANVVIPGTVVSGLQNAAWNLDQAIAIKVLPISDPADLCVHGALQAIGQDVGQTPVAAQQFIPKVSDLISAGSVAYILAQQAKTLAGNGGLSVPPSCEQLVGHFVLAGVNAPANAIINGALAAAP